MSTRKSNLNSLDASNPALNATVSASAGSGKTWLLITRIVRLLIEGADPGNIIALTFTRKAAGEMQIRLNQRLFEMATADDSDLEALLRIIDCGITEENKKTAAGLYEKIMHSPYPVRIQTFHSFCQDILARFPLEADIPPGFDLLEDSSLLQRQAWQMLFDKASLNASRSRLNKELDIIMQFCNGPDNTLNALNSFLNHRSDWWAYTSHSQNPVAYACNRLATLLDIEDLQDMKTDQLTEQFLSEANKVKLSQFAGLLREIKNKTSEKHAASIEQALHECETDSNTAFNLIKSAFIKKDGEILSQGRSLSPTLEKKLGIENSRRFIELHLEISRDIMEVNELEKRLLSYRINRAWYYAGSIYLDLFQQLKREMRLLDFTDLEWKCYMLLQHADNAHWVQYKIDQRIDHLLIDEFQDTNPTQWHLLSPILEEIAAGQQHRQRSVFLVGDEKQSIYSFRRANPALQAQASNWLADRLDARATPLDFSRRSSPAIINCVNLIFDQPVIKNIMNSFVTHDTYLDSLPGKVLLFELFRQDDEDTGENEQSTHEEIYFRNPLLQARELNTLTARHREAEHIARQIQHLINKPEFITDQGKARCLEFGDIMILMRNRTHIAIYENALKQHGIPYIGSKKGGLLDNIEIQDLSCLLNTLMTPFNNLALAQVLKSPIFSATDEDLILLAQHNDGSTGSQHWYERLLQLAADPESKTGHALRRASHLLPRWQQLAEQLPVHDCLDMIFSEGNIINRFIAASREENKQKVAANCQRFLELSLETDSGRYPSITRFLQRLNKLESHSDSPPEEPLAQNNANQVTLLTIHGSKGLEAPVVFLADCNSNPRNTNAYASLVSWPASQSRPVNFQLQLNRENTDQVTRQLQQEKLNEQAREELNLLYVAVTRAREQLYISGSESGRRNNNSWYQTIYNGLEAATQKETGIDDINQWAYRYAEYNVTTPDKKHNTEIKQAVIDERLLKPFTAPPASTFMIAPGLSKNSIFDNQENLPAQTADDGINDIKAEQHYARWRGVIIHRILELLCQTGEYPANNNTTGEIQQQIQSEILSGHPAGIEQMDDCMQEAISTYNSAELETIFNPCTGRSFNEMPLMYMQKQQAVYGIVDRVIKTDDTIYIVDYKSHQLNNTESLQTLAQQFLSQIGYYRNGIEKLWPDHLIKAGILFTHYREIVWLE
jgi:ATP-dependent helicase/nuclease subunit A